MYVDAEFATRFQSYINDYNASKTYVAKQAFLEINLGKAFLSTIEKKMPNKTIMTLLRKALGKKAQKETDEISLKLLQKHFSTDRAEAVLNHIFRSRKSIKSSSSGD
jgi:hypothetical protein